MNITAKPYHSSKANKAAQLLIWKLGKTVGFSLYFSYAISVMISCDANTISTRAMG